MKYHLEVNGKCTCSLDLSVAAKMLKTQHHYNDRATAEKEARKLREDMSIFAVVEEGSCMGTDKDWGLKRIGYGKFELRR